MKYMVLDKYGTEFEVDEVVWKTIPITHKRTIAEYGKEKAKVAVGGYGLPIK